MPVWKRRPSILLCPNIPKPLHGVNPRSVLGDRWWDSTRKRAYKRTNYRCQACGVHKKNAKSRKWLEGHELYDTDYEAGRLTYIETVPLCHFCHNYIHDGRMHMLLQQGYMPQAKFVAIIQHGDRVLADAGLRRPTLAERELEIILRFSEGKCARWDQWRLVAFNKEYPPKFKTLEEWEMANVKS